MVAPFAALLWLIALLNPQRIDHSIVVIGITTFDYCAKGATASHFSSGINEQRCRADYPELFE